MASSPVGGERRDISSFNNPKQDKGQPAKSHITHDKPRVSPFLVGVEGNDGDE